MTTRVSMPLLETGKVTQAACWVHARRVSLDTSAAFIVVSNEVLSDGRKRCYRFK
jgi:hypothetical protein